LIKFSPANTKLKKLQKKIKKKVYSFDLLSGHSCPCANECYSKVVNGKVVDGKNTKFRCYSASQEAVYKNVFNLRNNNLQAFRKQSSSQMTNLILQEMPKNAKVIRIHSSGDFFSKAYLRACINAAKTKPEIIFYFYTKFLPGLIEALPLPDNMVYTASYGGTHDYLIEEHNLRYVKVVFSKNEAKKSRLPLDINDYHAYNPNSKNNNFALLIHGIQPAGSLAAQALSLIKKLGH